MVQLGRVNSARRMVVVAFASTAAPLSCGDTDSGDHRPNNGGAGGASDAASMAAGTAGAGPQSDSGTSSGGSASPDAGALHGTAGIDMLPDGGLDAPFREGGSESSAPDAGAGDATSNSDPVDSATAPFPSTLGYVSGTRLRAVFLESAEGTRTYRHFFDTELGAPCDFARVEDGTLRCLPLRARFQPWFTDAVCSEAFLGDDPCGEPRPAYVSFPSSGPQCDPIFEVRVPYQRGARTTALAAYESFEGQCQKLGDNVEGYPLTTVDPSLFVEGQLAEEPVADGLSVRFVTAADGARRPVSAVISATGEACAPTRFFDGALRCVDRRHANDYGDRYLSDQCAGETVGYDVEDVSCPVPAVLLRRLSGSCPLNMVESAHDVGAPVDPAYQSPGSVCGPASSGRYFRGGAEVDPGEFPRLETVRTGSGRLRAEVLTTASGVPLMPAGLWDAQYGDQCAVHTAPDQSTRCFVSDIDTGAPDLQVSGYGDPQCTEPLTMLPSCGTFTGVVLYSPDAWNGCTSYRLTRVSSVLPAYEGTWFSALGACQPMPGPAPPGWALYPIGPDLRFTDFPVLTERME